MKWRAILPLFVVLVVAAPTFAGIFGSKKPTKPPAERVSELITVLKTDGDENKRFDAAAELRNYDPTQFPHMIPALIEALRNDAKPSVRAEAAQTLGKVRPINQQVGLALIHARDKDASMRVRIQARSSLLSYKWGGFKEGETNEPPIQSKEPPLADPRGDTAPPVHGPQLVPPVNTSKPLTPDRFGPPLPPAPRPSVRQPMTSPPTANPSPVISRPVVGSTAPPRIMPSGPRRVPAQTVEPPLAPPLAPPVAPPLERPTPVPAGPQIEPTGPELPPQE